MHMVEPRFVSRMDRPLNGAMVDVATPTLGIGRVIVSDRAIHAAWESTDLPSLRRGCVNVEARILMDDDGAWVPQAVLVAPAGGRGLDGTVLRTARGEASELIGGEVVAAASEALLKAPDEIVEAIRNGPSGVDDDIIAAGVTRVLERLETDGRLIEVERILTAEAGQGDPTPREVLEDMARQMRSTPFSF